MSTIFNSVISPKGDPNVARSLAFELLEGFSGQMPDLIFVFADADLNLPDILSAIQEVAPSEIIGATTGGGLFANRGGIIKGLCIAGLVSNEMRIVVSHATGISRDLHGALKTLTDPVNKMFPEALKADMEHGIFIFFFDPLFVDGNEVVRELRRLLPVSMQIAGSAAGDSLNFRSVKVIHNYNAFPDAIVGAAIYSKKPIAASVAYGWEPLTIDLNITNMVGKRVYEIQNQPAINIWKQIFAKKSINMAPENIQRLLASFPIGYRSGVSALYKIRTPVKLYDDGSVELMSPVPNGIPIRIMHTTIQNLVSSSLKAAKKAIEEMEGVPASGLLVLDSLPRLLVMGDKFYKTMAAVNQILPVKFAGFHGYGEGYRLKVGPVGYNNGTASFVVFPK